MTRTDAFTDILLALALTVVAGVAAGLLANALSGTAGVPLAGVLLIQGVIIMAGLQALLAWRGESWGDLGLGRFRPWDVGRALQALLLVFAVNALFALAVSQLLPGVLERHQRELSGFANWLVGDLSVASLIAVTLFIGLYEEVLARGYLLGRCRVLLPGVWAPVVLSSVLFGLGHFYQGGFGIVQTTIVGVVFARLVLRWDNLWPVILAHAALNFISLSALRMMEV